MKGIINSGSRIRAYCSQCKKIQQSTYAYGPFEFDNGVIANNVLRALCDECQTLTAVAQQSAAVLKEALETKEKRSTMRVPQELLDFITLQLVRLGARPTHYDLFLRAILAACQGKEAQVGEQLKQVSDPVLNQPCTATLNIAFNSYLQKVIDELCLSSGITNTSDLLRRLLVLTEEPSLTEPVTTEASRLVMVCSP